MMSITDESQLRVVDGVQVMGAPKKVGPFYQYQVFAVQLHDGRTFEFYTDKIYKVRTVGKIGYANLKMIFINEKTSKCFSRFVLFHLPENTKRGTQVWKHGQDELLKFSHNIIIRCSRVLAWAIPERDKQTNGTRCFTNNDMEVYQNRDLSLVRLKRDSKTDYSEHYSVFAGNSKLSKKLGFDVTKAEFIPNIKVKQKKEIGSIHSSETKPNGRRLISNEQRRSDKKVFSAKREASSTSNVSINDEVTDVQSTKSRMPKNHLCREKKEYAMSGKLNRSSLFRSCKSVYSSPRKERIEEGQGTSGKMKKERTLSSISLATCNIIELECKIKILSYVDYLTFMKCQIGLKEGLIIERDEALVKEVIASNGNNCRIYFVRASFADKDILRSTLFEKTIGRKCQFGKKRKLKEETIEVKSSESSLSDAEATEFMEDDWKQVSEELYFERIGHKRNNDPGCLQGKRRSTKIKCSPEHSSHQAP